ncbi:MAG: guanylate kinase [Kiritimatiellae bacterium]|nr:guanylate kinase [Kiritimatiellia bacterium]
MTTLTPILIIVSAPSGAGKTTLCERLLAEFPEMVYSVSCTTRAPRGEEVDGRDYCFLSDDEFATRVEHDDFLEHAVVHGHHYGTLRESVGSAMRNGQSVLMDIDVQGAAQVREALLAAGSDDPTGGHWVDIFISPPSLEALRERLEGRGEDAPEVIEGRLKNAGAEMARASEYRYTVINDDLDEAYTHLHGIVVREAGGES